MRFFNPLAFIGLISIPIIIIMYLLKQKHKEVIISSIQLWQKALMQSEAQSPWQRLRKNILMFLQILAATLLVLAMSKPYIIGIGEIHNYILVLDSSMSMQATDELPNRFESAKKQMNKFIDNIEPNSKISLVVMNNNPYTAFTSADKNTSKNIIEDIKLTDSNINLEMTASIVEMLYQETEGNIYVFSDDYYKFNELNSETILIGNSIPNTAITLLSHSIYNDQISALVKVKNYSDTNVEQSVSLYADGLLHDTIQINLDPNEEERILFDNIQGSNLEARLEQKDNLNIDDTAFDIVSDNSNKKVLLASEQNVFLEKALSILDIELYKSKIDEIENLNGYDLYVFDNVLPDELPKDGHIFIINPPTDNNFIKVYDELKVNSINIKDRNLLKFATDINFSVSKAKKIEVPNWANIIIDSDVAPLILFGENNNQKQVIFNFDLHNTDLPLKKEFPIFIYNLVDWYMPQNVINKESIFAGDTIDFNLKPNIDSARIITSDNNIIEIVPPFPVAPFSGTSKVGIYTLEQKIDDNTIYNNFAVNCPLNESNLLRTVQSIETNLNTAKQTNKNIANIFIIILLMILIIEWFLYKNKNNLFKKRLIAITRFLVIVLIILSLFNLQIRKSTNNTTTIFAVDLSDSVSENEESIKDFINQALQTKSNNDNVGLITFAESGTVESSVSKQLVPNFNSKLNTDATNIENALKLSSVLIPENTLKRIVLFSDGQQNQGDILQQAKLLNQQNIVLDIYPLKNNISKEVQITSISVPENINKNTEIDLEVNINSLNDTKSVLKLYKNNTVISTESINVHKGDNKFVFNDVADIGGSVVYKAEIEPVEDTLKQNNIAYTHTYITDIPKVLILDNNDSGVEIQKILINSGIEAVRQNAVSAPDKSDKLLPYSLVILADVNINLLPKNSIEILESFVKTSGGGLFVSGGTDSYALGGYQKTLLETIMPVEMQLKDKSKDANLGMIIVTDRSGSMSSAEYGISKLSLAKEAIIRAVDSLTEKDSIGVIAFDSIPIIITDFQQIGNNKQSIKDNIAGITSGGGTSILPALKTAYDTILKADTKLKHIILLTDGQAETSGYDSLIQSMQANNITLSTVAVGTDSDQQLLKSLAEKANGRYYYSNIFTDLPEIFAKEAFLAGKTFINNRSFYPKINNYSTIIEGISQIPSLDGYIASTAKPRADVILVSDKDDPILSSWQYGLGKVVAWTSDLDGRWSSNWLSSSEGIKILRNTISSMLKIQTSDVALSGSVQNNSINIKAVTENDKDIKSIKANIVTPNMENKIVELNLTSPNVYEGNFLDNTVGVYVVNLQIEKQNGDIEIVNSGININYSEEYNIQNLLAGETLLKNASNITGGKILTSPDEVFNFQNSKVYSEKDITTLLLLIALILFLFEIALRRFPIISNKLELTAAKLGFILKNKDIKINKSPKPIIKKDKQIKDTKSKKEKISDKSIETSNILAQNKKKRIGR